MNIYFYNKNNGNYFRLGKVSFNYLDQQNVFDEANTDRSPDIIENPVIWATDQNGCNITAQNIITALQAGKLQNRPDLEKKLECFATFLLRSNCDIRAAIEGDNFFCASKNLPDGKDLTPPADELNELLEKHKTKK